MENKSMTNKFFSHASHHDHVKFARQFADYLKEQFPQIKRADQLTASHFNSFLETKVGKCSRATLATYYERARKIGTCLNKKYLSCNINLTQLKKPQVPTKEERLRQSAMKPQEFEKLLGTMKNPCGSRDGVELGRAFGLRLQSISKIRVHDVDFQNNVLTIYKDKGGKTRLLPIETTKQRELLERLVKGKRSGERLISVRASSISNFLREHMNEAGLRHLTSEKTGMHSIRKMVAQERYDVLRGQGVLKQESANAVSEYLGHGDNRKDILEIYVENAW